jgi:hypothetical protein
MKFKPLGARAMVKEAEREQTTESAIVLPDTAKEKPQSAEVVATGAHEDVKVSAGAMQDLVYRFREDYFSAVDDKSGCTYLRCARFLSRDVRAASNRW